MDAVLIIRTLYITAAITILFIKAIPPLSARFLDYGSRTASSKAKTSNHNGRSPKADRVPSKLSLAHVMDIAASLQVPHSWFASFYIISITSSLFWAFQFIFGGSVLNKMMASTPRVGHSMMWPQVIVTWSLMLVQGCRRLYESLAFGKSSSSRMWIGHWFLGVWFYLMIGVSIWIEAIPIMSKEDLTLFHFQFTPPSFRTFLGVIMFTLASGVQHDCHFYLASLKKYTLPEHPAFQAVLCPHYLAECMIYLSLSILVAPRGHVVNRTVFCALVFVATNLGVTADGTKQWYGSKFGSNKVASRYRMVPFIY